MTSSSSHSFKEQDFHIPIAFAFDKNYLIPAGACIYSLLESIAKANKKNPLHPTRFSGRLE